jgi:hypothetical protein
MRRNSVVTHSLELAAVRRLQLHVGEDGEVSNQHDCKKGKKQPTTVSGAPPQALSGTVKMLFKEVAAIKREQQVRR